MKRNIIFITLLLFGLFLACERPDVGYLSDNIFYNTNPFEVQQGVTTFSSTIVANGSTTPLSVDLLKVKDESGEDVTEEFTEPGNIVTFSGTITWQDSTLEMLQTKLKDSLVTPFAVNSIGGRLEFSAATAYLNTGTYNIDVLVGNSKGEYTIEDACEINLIEVEDAYSMNYKRVTTNGGVYETTDSYITVDVDFRSGGDASWCIYKFLDKNGTPFNPANGEITRRASTYPFFDDWNPWYPIELTDTAFVQQMPHYQGIDFPYYTELNVGGTAWSDISARYDWRIPKGYIQELDEVLYGLISFEFFSTGTYVITTQLHQYTKEDQ